ncbi:MAG: hypothetical protein ACOYVF_11015 [Candidatus Zixiibacteriota bacterium]
MSCSDDDCPTCPDNSNIPLFTVTVVDTLGNPVEGIRIGSMNHFYNTPLVDKALVLDPQVSTEIVFSLAHESYVTLIIYDYYWNPVKVLLDEEQFVAGTISVGWDGTDILNRPIKSGYYYAYLWTQFYDEPDSILIDTSAMVMEVGNSPVQTVIGYTDRNGIFSTDDTLYFPCLLGSPPAVQARNESGILLDSLFHYSDTVTITLSTLEDGYILIDTTLVVGSNEFELVWSPEWAE